MFKIEYHVQCYLILVYWVHETEGEVVKHD